MNKIEYDIAGSKRPIQYKGFKSKLEYIASKWLAEELKLKTLYEPQTYRTKIGNYTPDFYCPEIKTYFECKPDIGFANFELYTQFVEEQEKDLVIITPKKLSVIEYWPPSKNIGEKEPWIINELEDGDDSCYIRCSHCQKISFCHGVGIYYCRACKAHEGDHDLSQLNQEVSFSFGKTSSGQHWDGIMIDFPSYYSNAYYGKNRGDLYNE